MTSKRKRSADVLSTKLEKLSTQYPQVYEYLFKDGDKGLESINDVLVSVGLKKVKSIERGCALLLPFLNRKRKRGATSIKELLSSPSEDGLGQFSNLANEIIVYIFEYVISGLNREEKINPYRRISKQIGEIINVAHKNLKLRMMSTLDGFASTSHLTPPLGCPPNNQYKLFCMKEAHKYEKGFIERLDKGWGGHDEEQWGLDLYLPNLEIDKSLAYNLSLFKGFETQVEEKKNGYLYNYSRRSNRITTFSERLYITDPNTIVWHWNYLIMEVSLSNRIKRTIVRVYKNNKPDYTLADILERILQFYQTPLTQEEYDDIYQDVGESIKSDPRFLGSMHCQGQHVPHFIFDKDPIEKVLVVLFDKDTGRWGHHEFAKRLNGGIRKCDLINDREPFQILRVEQSLHNLKFAVWSIPCKEFNMYL